MARILLAFFPDTVYVKFKNSTGTIGLPVAFERYISRLVDVEPVTHKYTHTFYLLTKYGSINQSVNLDLYRTTHCTIVQSAVLRCPSVRLSVRLCWIT